MMLGLVLCWLLVLLGAWLGWQLLRQNGRMLLRLEELENRLNELEFGKDDEPEGLPVGSGAPPFELPDLDGKTRKLSEFVGQPIILLFFNPDCGFCRDLLPELEAASQPPVLRSASDEGGSTLDSQPRPLLIISTGDSAANRSLFEEHKLDCTVLLQNKMEVAAAYQAHGTPSGYLIDAEGKIASQLGMGAEALLALLAAEPQTANPQPPTEENANAKERADRFSSRSLARSKIKRDGLKAGTPAPDFTLPRLDGKGELSLTELRGRPVLLVFSSPSCGPCVELAPHLQKFHRERPEIELVMISKGEPKENRTKAKEHGPTFPILLQQQWEISRKYAIFATPVGYLINESGVITHDVAVGTEAILALMIKARSRTAGEPSSNGVKSAADLALVRT